MMPQNANLAKTTETEDRLSQMHTSYDPIAVKKLAEKEITSFKDGAIDPSKPLFKALTLNEFENGVLMTTVIPEQYRTFAIDMSRNLQLEYNCQTASEKATCELVAVTFIRVLEIQRKLNDVLGLGTTTPNLNQYIATLSKELDRANRQYQSMLQTLRILKQVPMQITVKAQTAVIGQNQLVRANNSHE